MEFTFVTRSTDLDEFPNLDMRSNWLNANRCLLIIPSSTSRSEEEDSIMLISIDGTTYKFD